MKKILFACAIVMLALCSCKPETITPKEDNVSIDLSSKVFDAEGGSVNVTVTSSGEWQIDGSCDWVTVSAGSGQSGDVVTFTAAPNETYESLEATYTFKVGEKTATFTISIAAHALPIFELKSANTVSVNCAQNNFAVELNTDVESDGITITSNVDWIKSAEENKFNIIVSENTTYEKRTGTVTLSAEMCDDITITVSQNAKTKIVLSAERYECESEACIVDVIVTEANIEYEVVIPDTCNDWISVQGVQDNTIKLSITGAEESREGSVDVVAVDGTGKATAVIAQEVVASQGGATVTVVDAVASTWSAYSADYPSYWNVTAESATTDDWGGWWTNTMGYVHHLFVNGYYDESFIRGNANGFKITIDMQQATQVAGLYMKYHASRGDTAFKLYASNDNVEWTEIYSASDVAAAANRYFAIEGLECRYFRYEALGESTSIGVQIFKMIFYHE